MSGLKTRCLYALGIIAVLIVCVTYRTILPFVKDGEYYEVTKRIDANIDYTVIHDDADCPLHGSAWFKEKHEKYNILIKDDASFCTECFHPDEVQKLIVIHRLNVSELYKRYCSRYPEQEAKQRLLEYNTSPDINEIYW